MITKYLDLLYKSRCATPQHQQELVRDISRRGFLRQIIDITIFASVTKTCCAIPSDYSKFLPDIGDSDRSNLSPADANFIGRQIIQDIATQGQMLFDYDVIAYLNNIGDELASNSPLAGQSFNFYSLNGKEVNAFALPGGYICVYNGLIYTTRSESELAGVMSHEIGHIVQHHIFRNIAVYNRNQWLSIAGVLAGALLAPFSPGAAVAAANGGQGLAIQNILGNSRDFEREADRVGQGIMYDGGFDPHAMPDFFSRLEDLNKFNNNEALAFLQTHPVTSERISEAEERANQLPVKMRADSISFLIIREKCRVRQLGVANAIIFYTNALKTKRYSNISTQYYGLAFAYFISNNPTLAISYLNKIHDLSVTTHPAYYSLLALVYTLNKNYAEARKVYVVGLSSFATYKGLWLGQVDMEIKAKQLKTAGSYLFNLSTQYPNDLDIWTRIAYVYSDSNLNNLQKYYYALGNKFSLQNEYKRALDQYQLAIKYAKTDKDDNLNDIISSKIIDTQQIIKFNAKYGNNN